MRWLKFGIGLILLPACAALSITVWQVAQALALAPGRLQSMPTLAFGAGYGLWLVVFVLLPKPTRTYVLGHELTHAVWALMMGARVRGLRVGKSGGQVRTSKTNWLITLAPYFFPFYAILFTILFYTVYAFVNLTPHLWVLFFLVGLGWSFHVTFTLMILLTVRQPDVQSEGALFSAVTIYLMNIVMVILTATALSPQIKAAWLLTTTGHSLWICYGWTLDKFIGIWQYLHSWVSQNNT